MDRGAPERVVAEVNGQPVFAGDLDAILRAERPSTDELAGPATRDTAADPRRRALDLLISAELLFQAALASELSVSDEELDARLLVVRSQFVTAEEFDAYLREGGLDVEGLRQREKRRLLIERYVGTITSGVRIDEAAARRLYDERPERFKDEEQIRVAQILVRLLPGASAERRREARTKIEEAHRRAASGEDFAELAREYSESPLAARGGDLGFFPRGRMLEDFERVVFATPVGAITPVFETAHGLNVAKVLERRESSVRPFEQVKAGLLMVLAREQRDQVLRRHVDELRAQAEIRVLDATLQ